jgi:hypothetical protein
VENEQAALENASLENASLEDLDDGDVFGLRLAAQVLGHKASLAGRPRVARWFADFEALAGGELARRGVGILLTSSPTPRLPAEAEPADRRLLAEYLRLVAQNGGLTAAQRAICQRLLSENEA